jgi:hypothetical protein
MGLSDKFCFNPFNFVEIDSEGAVYTCCPPWIDHDVIGNIIDVKNDPISEIWNSKDAQQIRSTMRLDRVKVSQGTRQPLKSCFKGLNGWFALLDLRLPYVYILSLP